MEWKKCYLDLILVPLGLLISLSYHVWLWHKVRTQPLTTVIGTNARGRRLWVSAMIKVISILVLYTSKNNTKIKEFKVICVLLFYLTCWYEKRGNNRMILFTQIIYKKLGICNKIYIMYINKNMYFLYYLYTIFYV